MQYFVLSFSDHYLGNLPLSSLQEFRQIEQWMLQATCILYSHVIMFWLFYIKRDIFPLVIRCRIVGIFDKECINIIFHSKHKTLCEGSCKAPVSFVTSVSVGFRKCI